MESFHERNREDEVHEKIFLCAERGLSVLAYLKNVLYTGRGLYGGAAAEPQGLTADKR